MRDLPWTEPYNRYLRDIHYKVVGARVELNRLDVEIDRIRDFLEKDRRDYDAAVLETCISNPPLSSELHNDTAEVLRVQQNILYWLAKCEGLVGFRGKRYPHVKISLRPFQVAAGETGHGAMEDTLVDEAVPPDPELNEGVDDIEDLLRRMERLG